MPATTPVIANAGIGTISYNGLTFNATRAAKLTCTPIYDQAGRVVTHLQYHLSVHGFIAETTQSACATAMTTLQNSLTAPGATLTLSTIGFDSVSITTDASGTRPEILWGTKPRLLSMEPVGGNIGWEFTWECEFNISRAWSASNSLPFMAFNYEWSVSIDQEGLSTRTIAGYAQVPAIRGATASRAVLFNVDDKWDQITVGIPWGFRRLVNQRRINDAKNRIDFVIVDQEFSGEAFPMGMVNADINYSFENVPPAFITWRGTISGTLTAAPGIPAWQEAATFFMILSDRIGKLKEAVAASGPDHWVLPETIRFDRNLFGRGSRFSCSFRVIGCLRDIVGGSGVFAPIGTNWISWQQSMQSAGVLSSRGRANLHFLANDDSLVDPGSNTPNMQIGNEGATERQIGGTYSDIWSCETTPEKSWIMYENKVKLISEANATIHRLSKPYTYVPIPAINFAAAVADMVASAQATSPGEEEQVEEYAGGPKNYLLFIGKGLRLRYHPVMPSITEYKGVKVVELARHVDVTPKGNYFGCPAFMGNWAILYLAKGSISGISASDNPAGCYVADQSGI